MPEILTPSRIILNHSYEAGAEPDPEFLEPGEIALNAKDNILFYLDENENLVKKSLDINNSIISITDEKYNPQLLKQAAIVDGELILTFADNSTKNLGNVKGPEGRGIGFDGVVDYVDELPLPPDLPNILNKSGTTYLVRLGTTSGSLFNPEGSRIYIYDITQPLNDRWVNAGILGGIAGPQGIQGEKGDQGDPGYDGLFSDATGITGATEINNIVKISQSNFDSLVSLNQLDANTTYLVF